MFFYVLIHSSIARARDSVNGKIDTINDIDIAEGKSLNKIY